MRTKNWTGGYNTAWRMAWHVAYTNDGGVKGEPLVSGLFTADLKKSTTGTYPRIFDDVTRQSFGTMAEEVGMRSGLALGRLDAMAKRIRPAARELASEMGSTGPCPVYSKIIAVIENQIKSVS